MPYDLLVIGGGATGAGVARDAALRGLKVALVERGEIGAATTAASTHLLHGELSSLPFDRGATRAACREAGYVARAARGCLTRLPIVWPVYRGHAHGLESVATLLEEYDRFQPLKGGRPHVRLTREACLRLVPGLASEGLVGAVAFDEWWADARALTRRTADAARAAGAEILTGAPVEAILREGPRAVGARAAGRELRARVTVNAAGPWLGRVAEMAGVRLPLRLMKGTHLIWKDPRRVPVGLLLEDAGRTGYAFVVPSPLGTWVGPTNLPGPDDPDRARAEPAEAEHLMRTVRRYFAGWPQAADASVTGSRPVLRPLRRGKAPARSLAIFDHAERDGVPGLLTVGGGKLTDARAAAEAVVDAACRQLGVAARSTAASLDLDGRPLGADAQDVPAGPGDHFCEARPALRGLHALARLGGAYAAHLARRAAGRGAGEDEAAFLRRYA